ncbi:prepilin-type N-terminal cleavage/methylation domain-containing protein [Arenimonas sp.]|nr:prepilin-type N-terminal cleavage/methylation domain-containing protein [Candidatus Parcubacteria bacterium]
MFKKNTKNNKGFTLIELMVVISIIGLLSSIVLATLKDARDKATGTKFKSEIKQLVTALELYRTDTGYYPYENLTGGSADYDQMLNSNTEQASVAAGQYLSALLLGKYLNSLPKVPVNNYTQTLPAWTYRSNHTNSAQTFRCVGDTDTPKYVILFSNQNPTTYGIFSDLPDFQFSPGFNTWITATTDRCFSLK